MTEGRWICEPSPVWGGWRISWTKWIRARPDYDDADQLLDWDEDDTVYPSREACASVILARQLAKAGVI